MFKPIAAVTPTAESIADQVPRTEADVTVNRLFMLFHGWYGNLFISKFATGERDQVGKDKGIKSARIVWSSELTEFDADTVMQAAKRCKVAHPEYPPSLPQFVAICQAVKPVRAFAVDRGNAIGMSTELKSSYSKRARTEAMTLYRERLAAQAGIVSVPDGLAGLKELIAKAVALAGGDEVAALLRLDREMVGA